MKLLKMIAVAAAVSVTAMSANAAVNYGKTAQAGQPYVGVKVGQFTADEVEKNATAYGVYGGYHFDQNLAAEVEFVGSADTTIMEAGSASVDYNLKTVGAYGVYHYKLGTTPFALKGKLGGAYTKFSVETKAGSSSLYAGDASDTTFAYGVGASYVPTQNFAVEAEYTRLASNVDLMTIGATLKF